MVKEIENNLGTIYISKEVIASIAGISAIECYGLVGMASKKVKDGISELLKQDNLSKGIVVELKDNQIFINIYVIIEYGINISEVANNVIEKVKFTLNKMLGINDTKIVINVQSVRVSNSK